jgi:putative CocE/NonD family hydrolase
MKNTSEAGRARHFLVIGPWDHAGTRVPQKNFAGAEFGSASLVDLNQLHLDWYGWTMQGGPKPSFLKKNVAYYVTGAERWRYTDTLEEITVGYRALYLDSRGNASYIFASGRLSSEVNGDADSCVDTYVYDPRDVSVAEQESRWSESPCLRPTFPCDGLTDQRAIYARDGKQLIYHSDTFERDTEISGFFRLSAWISIDQPDTDFSVSVYELDLNGGSMLLSADAMRARYREGLRAENLIRTQDPLHYSFEGFTFVSRLVRKGSRLRLVIGPMSSIHHQKNYNSGAPVSEESIRDARPVTVKLFHGREWKSILYAPLGQSE